MEKFFLTNHANSNDDEVMNLRINVSTEKLDAFCTRWQIIELALFGSVLRDDFGPRSDVDVLVRFESNVRHTLLDMVQMEDELCSILGRKVDLIARAAIERSPNYIRRKTILESAKTIYAR